MVCNAGPTGWRVTQHGGHGWQRECPALAVPGLERLPPPLPSLEQAKPEQLVALASSSRWCEIMQVGDWVFMAHLMPGLRVVLHDVPSRLIPVGYACRRLRRVVPRGLPVVHHPTSISRGILRHTGVQATFAPAQQQLCGICCSAASFQSWGLHSMLTAQRSSGQIVACQHDMPPAQALA